MTHEELNKLEIFSKYTQKELAKLWGYKSYDAIRRGVVTPSAKILLYCFLLWVKGLKLMQIQIELKALSCICAVKRNTATISA